ncbi:MAG: hypothetical protein AAFO29_01590 [Actinomycetota bacterium]
MQGARAGGAAAWQHAATGTTLVVAAVAVGAMWGPWFASGSATRNSFGLFRAAQVLGIEWVTPYRVAWFLLPTVLAAAAALIVFGARRTGLVVLGVLGGVLGAAGVLAATGLEAQWGSTVSAGAGLCTVVAAGATLVASMIGATTPSESMASGGSPKLSTEN